MLIGKTSKALPSHNRNRAITIGGRTMTEETNATLYSPQLRRRYLVWLSFVAYHKTPNQPTCVTMGATKH
jgi:hypothetical protein